MKNENITTSNAEMVTISRTEYNELKLQNQWLLEQLGLAKKRQFGASSERLQEELMEQFSLSFNEAEGYAYGTKAATAEQIAVKAHARNQQSGSVTDIVPEGTPRKSWNTVFPRKSGPVLPAELSWRKLGRRSTAVCRWSLPSSGSVRISTIPTPARIVSRKLMKPIFSKRRRNLFFPPVALCPPRQWLTSPSRGASLAAYAAIHLLTQKFVMYSPLYRLEQEFNREGLKLSRQTMANWILNVSDTWLRPIYDALHQKFCCETILHGDETTLQVLKESGKAATSKSYMWLYRTSGCAENPIVLYEYQPNRKAEHAERFLKGFSGCLHADGYQGYHKLPENIRVVGCWAHA